LKAAGAKAVFGIPGDYALPLFESIEQSGILPLFTLSHEPAVAFAADAAARVSGGVGVAATTYGAGALNLVNGVAAAYAERSPLVVVSAVPPKSTSSPTLSLHHQIRGADTQLRIFREITCAQAVLDDAATAPALIAQTLGECKRLSLPVYFELPRDMARVTCAPFEPLPQRTCDGEAVAECAAEIAALVRSAKRPVVMIGVEVRRFGLEAEVADLARRAKIPVVTSFMGRGVAASYGINSLGSYLGLAGDPEIAELVEQSDALILLGVILCDTNLGLPAHRLDLRRVVHAFGGAVRIGHHNYPDVALKDLVQALFRHAPDTKAPSPMPYREADLPGDVTGGDAKPSPSDVAVAVNDLFARHGPMPVACDVGDSLFVSLELESTDLVAQAYYASMGFAVPAALGIQAATGARPLVLVGDGAFQMTGWELGNCRRYGLDPIVVVLNNQSWEMLRLFSPDSHFNALGDWHFADIAQSLGGDGVRVRSRRELSEALDQAWRRQGKFQLIEVMLEPGSASGTLQKFVGALAPR
ncbi:MAG TPA: indolepyruvate/phenylpyruvate decarboxylase, partial [Rhizomicrobium sp.]|nr:indolepyruvate/phenylpyruvate decarboxylase [Rhizomicrobium sp.]